MQFVSLRSSIEKQICSGGTIEGLLDSLCGSGLPPAEATNTLNSCIIASFRELQELRQHKQKAWNLQEALRIARESSSIPAAVERPKELSNEDFLHLYYARNIPVVISDLVTQWPAFNKWSPEYFKKQWGHMEVTAMFDRVADPKYDERGYAHEKTVRFSEFVDLLQHHLKNDVYLTGANNFFSKEGTIALWGDLIMKPGLLLNRCDPRLVGLWFGGQGTITGLHYDQRNAILAQIFGNKKVTLVPALEYHLLKVHHEYFAEVPDADCDGRDRGPVPTVIEVYLHPGEALFIPVGWWHQVESLSTSISVSLSNFCFPNHYDL